MRKPWGEFHRPHIDAKTELTLLKIAPGGYCSRHSHDHKSNTFFVVDGVLRIVLYFESGDTFESYDLTPSTPPLHVPSGRIHQFHAMTGVVAWEFSVADEDHMLDLNDIRRLSEPGTGNEQTC